MGSTHGHLHLRSALYLLFFHSDGSSCLIFSFTLPKDTPPTPQQTRSESALTDDIRDCNTVSYTPKNLPHPHWPHNSTLSPISSRPPVCRSAWHRPSQTPTISELSGPEARNNMDHHTGFVPQRKALKCSQKAAQQAFRLSNLSYKTTFDVLNVNQLDAHGFNRS